MSWLVGPNAGPLDLDMNMQALVSTLDAVLVPHFAAVYAQLSNPLYERAEELEQHSDLQGSRLAFYDDRTNADREELLTELSDVYDLVKALMYDRWHRTIESEDLREFVYDDAVAQQNKHGTIHMTQEETEDGKPYQSITLEP